MSDPTNAPGAVSGGGGAPVAGMEKVFERSPLLGTNTHSLCPGCGEPSAVRVLMENLAEMGEQENAVCVLGIGCYTAFGALMEVDIQQAMHGRAPAQATGVKRVLPDRLVFTLQGDGDMITEGIQEVIHAAARGEKITAICLNNAAFGETGGHMTATSVIGQRTKSTLGGRDAARHGYPIRLPEMLVGLEGVAYVARGTTHTPTGVKRVKKLLRAALETQRRGLGFSLVEILTMCPTGWFVTPAEGPKFQQENILPVFPVGELKRPRELDG
ncbi:MAG TPA: thiamine pyrophosphate-dependent enzyme [Candidatus Binatia bacterium]|nr:thiamine pyrophosphate-dependent enzyme [Candidatus Binatia bacterium]